MLKSKEITIPFSGQSMWPIFKSGTELRCEIYSQPEPASKMEVGEVYLTKDQSEWVVHRCIESSEKFILKGDWSMLNHSAEFVWGKVIDDQQLWKKRMIANFSKKTSSQNILIRYSYKLILLLSSALF